METRLPQTIPNPLKIYAGKTVTSHKIKEEVQTGFICGSKNGHVTYQHENEACKEYSYYGLFTTHTRNREG